MSHFPRYFRNGDPAWASNGGSRPGIIMGGRCVMAPARLSTLRESDCSFLARCRNGINVTVDGEKVEGGVGAYDEKRGSVVVLSKLIDGATLKTLSGVVRAYPGSGA